MLHAQPTNSTAATMAQQTACATPPSEATYIEAALRLPVPRRVRYSRGARRWRLIVLNATVSLVAVIFAASATSAPELPTEVGKVLILPFVVLCEFCVIAVVGTLVTLPRLKRHANLLRDGVTVAGTVITTPVEPWREVNRNHVTYTFQTLKGATYTHTVSVPTEVLKRIAVGTETTILYDPSDHAVSYPYNAITVAELV